MSCDCFCWEMLVREVGIHFLLLEWRIMAETSEKIYCLWLKVFPPVIDRKSSNFLTKRCWSCSPDQTDGRWRLQRFSNCWSQCNAKGYKRLLRLEKTKGKTTEDRARWIYHTWHNNQVRFGGEICHTKFAGISINVSAIFASRDEGGFCNVRSHALFTRYSLLKQKGLLVLVYNA